MGFVVHSFLKHKYNIQLRTTTAKKNKQTNNKTSETKLDCSVPEC